MITRYQPANLRLCYIQTYFPSMGFTQLGLLLRKSWTDKITAVNLTHI